MSGECTREAELRPALRSEAGRRSVRAAVVLTLLASVLPLLVDPAGAQGEISATPRLAAFQQTPPGATDLSLSASTSPTSTSTPPLLVGDNVTVTATVTNEYPASSVIDISIWPNAATTGVDAGTTLTPYAGPMVITTPGTTIQDADISGCLEIAADNVTIENSRIICGTGIGVWQYTGVNGLSMDRIDFVGTGTGAAAVYGIGSYTLTNSHIRGFVDGLKVDNDDTIIGNYIHDLVTTVNSHNDVIQASGGSNTVIRGNRLEHTKSQTSGYIVKADLAPISNYLIEENLLSGGAFNQYIAAGTMCCGGAFPEPTGMVIRNNVTIADSWLFGSVVAQGALQLGGSNVFECLVDETGVPLELYWRDLQTAGIGQAPCASLSGITGVAGSVGTATGVTVADVLPDGLQYIGHNGSGSYDPQTDVWSPSVIAPASSQSITIFAQAPTASTFTSSPQIMSADQLDDDSTPANNDPAEDDQTTLSVTAVTPTSFPPVVSAGAPTTQSSASGNPTVGLPSVLSATASDPDGDLDTVRWDLDNDGVFETTDPATFTPTTSGSVSLDVEACDLAGACTTATTTFNVEPSFVCGARSQEAEAGVLTGAMAVVADSGASGGSYIAAPELSGNDYFGGQSTATATYCMTTTGTDSYTLQAMITGNGGTSDSIWARVDGGSWLNWALLSGGLAIDEAYNWGSANPAVFTLGAGDHTIELFTREDGVFVDWVELVPLGSQATGPGGSAPTGTPPSITVNGPYTTPRNVAVPLSATATDPDVGDVLIISWDLDGDGTFETPDPATFTPTSASLTTITAQVCDGTFCATSSSTVTGVESPPTVSANAAQTAHVGTSVSLTATAADANGDALTVAWDLDGDGTFESPDPASFTPTAVGTTTVSVLACDALGCATDSTTVTGTNTDPTVSANGPYTTVAGTAVSLSSTAADADGDPVTVTWDLDGDGTFESADPASITPAAAGSTTVTVQACDGIVCVTDTATVTATAVPTPPNPGGGCGALSQEAEAGTLAGVMAVVPNGGASGGSIVGVPEGTKNDYSQVILTDYVEFCMTVTTADNYAIETIATGNGGTSDSFWVEIDGSTPRALWSVPSGGLATDLVSVQGGVDPLIVPLTAGDHTIRFYLREDGTELDTVTLVGQGGTPPTPPTPPTPGPTPTPPAGCSAAMIEAEAATLVGVMATVSDTSASGGIAVEVPNGTKNDYSQAILADYAEFCMFAPTTGNYRIDAPSTGAGPTSDSFWVSINGAPVVLWSIPSGGYTNDQVSEQGGADPVVWPLAAGAYTVRFYLREDGTRLDAAGLVPTTAPATANPPPATGPANPPPASNTPPTANAGGPYTLAQGTSMVLNGAGGDADGDPLTLSWDLDDNGTFESANPATYVATTAGTFDIHLQVCDGTACTTDTATMIVTPSCGGLTQEAEDGSLNGAMTGFNDAAASGQRAVRTPQGTPRDYAGGQSSSYVEFCITVPTSGAYRVVGRVRAPNGGSDSFWVQFNNGALALWDLGSSSNYRTDSVSHRGGPDPVVWNLPAGDHTLRFYVREDGAVLDRFTIVPI